MGGGLDFQDFIVLRDFELFFNLYECFNIFKFINCINGLIQAIGSNRKDEWNKRTQQFLYRLIQNKSTSNLLLSNLSLEWFH